MLSLACAFVMLTGCSSQNFRAAVQYQPLPSGERIAYYERGQGRPLVMLTGTGSTMSEWDPALLRLLSKNHRLILLDYPGIGMSSGYQGRLSFSRVSDQVAAFLAARQAGKTDVLGWSMGGFVAQQLAVRHPDLVRRLVLAGTNPGGAEAVLGSSEDQRSDSDPTPSDAQVIAQLYPRTPSGRKEGRAFLERLISASQSGEIPDDFEVPEQTQAAQVKAEDRWLSSNANWKALKDLQVPVLATSGRLDRVTPPVNLRRIARQTDGEYRQFPGSHGFLFSDRAKFSELLRRFLG